MRKRLDQGLVTHADNKFHVKPTTQDFSSVPPSVPEISIIGSPTLSLDARLGSLGRGTIQRLPPVVPFPLIPLPYFKY